MPMLISEIAKEIAYQYLTEEERKLNQNVLARKLNQLLIQSGDLTVCALGKIETEQGSRHGISGELVCPEDKPRYWLPKYTRDGHDYVLSLFQANRAFDATPFFTHLECRRFVSQFRTVHYENDTK